MTGPRRRIRPPIPSPPLTPLHQRTGVEKVGHYRIRPPVKPLTVGELAALEGTGTVPADRASTPIRPKRAEA